MRVTVYRDEPHYHVIYNQRTACEQITCQAEALGSERPKVRNLNTLTYLVINVRVLANANSITKGLLQMN